MNKKKINILFVLPNFDTGGSEKLVIDIIKNIDKNRFNPVLVVFFTGTYEKEFLKLEVPFYVVHRDKLRSKFSTFWYLKRIVDRHDINIVNTHHTSPLVQGLSPFKIFGKRIMVHTEHSRLEHDPRIYPRAIHMEKFFLKKVDAVIGISPGVCDYFRNELRVPEKKIKMIVNGVDIKRFELKDFNQYLYREKLGFMRDDFLVGMFGNFRPEKNHKILIQAFAIIKNKGKKNIQLLLCGSGPTENEAKELAASLDVGQNVKFMGTRLDIPELMNILDVYCLPSIFEGLPISILEAMASAKPVVATNVSGNNEVVLHRKTGILTAPNSSEELARGIVELMDDVVLRQELGKGGYERVKEFTFNTMIEKYERLFNEMFEAETCHGPNQKNAVL